MLTPNQQIKSSSLRFGNLKSSLILFRNALIFLLVIIFLGTFVFHFLEKWPLHDSFYFTIIFLTTIGLGDLAPTTVISRIFATFLAISGVGIVVFSIGQFARIMVEGEIQRLTGRRKLVRGIKGLKKHFIICGFNRLSQLICKELARNKVPFVIIEQNSEKLTSIQDENDQYLFIHGDATVDAILRDAHVEDARGLVTTISNDAENVFIVLTARDLNPTIHLISTASNERTEEKLRRAGAHLVISPTEIGGRRIVQGILRPSVMDFIDLALFDSNLELQMEEVPIPEDSQLANQSIEGCGIKQKFDTIIIGIKRAQGDMVFNPNPAYQIKVGDTLIALGKKSDMERMTKSLGT